MNLHPQQGPRSFGRMEWTGYAIDGTRNQDMRPASTCASLKGEFLKSVIGQSGGGGVHILSGRLKERFEVWGRRASCVLEIAPLELQQSAIHSMA
jgi:hypothetical protein